MEPEPCLAAADLETSVQEARCKLYAARSRRVPPGLDDKILTGWNGLMIRAMAAGARVLGDARYRAAAARAADFLLGTLRREDGRLLRTFREGRAHLDAVLEDYACLAEGLRGLEALLADREFELDGVAEPDRGTTVREELLMLQGHNSYHLGQIVMLRQELGAWPPPRGGNTW